jgi:N-methylhydantoinase A/acetophenone carboxylase
MDGKSHLEAKQVGQAKKPAPLIPRYLAVGVKERIDYKGRIVRPLNEKDALEKIDYLIQCGVRGFVICLLWSYENPVHEQRIRELIEQEYPEAMLASVPVVISSEICPKMGDYPRMITTLLDAYLHQTMWTELFGLSREVRAKGYRGRPLMMVHNTGGMADLYHTTAIQCHNAGPVAGLVGAAYLGKLMGYENIVVGDVGGTSFDIGTVIKGNLSDYAWRPCIAEWQVNWSMLETMSIGAGGGSIAWLNKTLGNRLEMGPKSAGSRPGPVAYDSGGTEPTTTDADVVLGYLDPGYFHGGKIRLNVDKARKAIKEKIAQPLGIELEEAALLMKKVIDANMGDVISRVTSLRGYDPKDFVIFAYGGGGPTHCCGFGFYAGMKKIVVFPFSPVFSAFGSSTLDVVHFYEKSKRVSMLEPGNGQYLKDPESFNQVINELMARAVQDISGEGFPTESIIFSLEMEMKYGGQVHSYRMRSPRLLLESNKDVKEICNSFGDQYARAFSPAVVYPEGGILVDSFLLRATVPCPKVELPEYPLGGEEPDAKAFKGKREAYWEEIGGWSNTPTYLGSYLLPGNLIEGPALVDAVSTTLVLPPNRRLSVDRYRNIIIE